MLTERPGERHPTKEGKPEEEVIFVYRVRVWSDRMMFIKNCFGALIRRCHVTSNTRFKLCESSISFNQRCGEENYCIHIFCML